VAASATGSNARAMFVVKFISPKLLRFAPETGVLPLNAL
jgi:hypothetical protein